VERYLKDDFLEEELEKRREENLPPFTKLILAVFPKTEKRF
jgi:primosomal protein N' (replication factor Y)